MLRVGFIGTGNFARQHAEVLVELGIQIRGCYGTNADKTLKFSEDFKCKNYCHLSELISPNVIDALYIVIPPFAHDGQAEMLAIGRNIPFLCEKPVGLDIARCQQITQRITERNLITSSGYLLRYDPIFQEVKNILSQQILSSVRICSYSFMPSVHWWRKKALSGGMLIEQGSHYIDLLRYLFGEISTSFAVASHGVASHTTPDCDLSDSLETVFKFKSGIIGSLGITHLLNNISVREDRLEVYGKDFSLKLDLYALRYKNQATVTYQTPQTNGWQSFSLPTSKKQLLTLESTAFLQAIARNDSALILSSYSDAVETLKIVSTMSQQADA